MDFDEYEYLEKTVENPGEKSKIAFNGGDKNVKSEEKGHSRSSKRRGEDDDEHKERVLSRHRSQSSERDSDRHRSSKEDKDRKRRRDNDKDGKERHHDGDRGRRHGDHERDKERGKSHDRDRERERECAPDRDRRSRSHSARHRDDRERSRDKDYIDRDSIDRGRENRHHKEKKEEAVEPEADPERDQRTVFAYQLPLRADERDVYEFFSRVGKVRDVRLIMDRNSRRSKGVGYIEFYDAMSVPMAIALSGQPLLGQPVMVKPSEAEKNLVQSTSTTSAAGGGGRRLYVGNLHYNITEEQLRQIFESFGSVELVQLPLDQTGHCKGFGFVQFARIEDAKAAETLNGQLEIAGRTIKVSAITDQTAGTQDATKTTGDLDDDESGGLSLNAQSRALLMAKLDRSGTASSLTSSLGMGMVNAGGHPVTSAPVLAVPSLGGLVGAGLSVPPVTVPSIDTMSIQSECLMLTNMFDPKLETEPDFDLDIKEDVQEECAKYGSLKHIYVDKNSAGHVYLRFDITQSAVNAQRALNGRWFAGKMITATFMVPQNYEAKFPECR